MTRKIGRVVCKGYGLWFSSSTHPCPRGGGSAPVPPVPGQPAGCPSPALPLPWDRASCRRCPKSLLSLQTPHGASIFHSPARAGWRGGEFFHPARGWASGNGALGAFQGGWPRWAHLATGLREGSSPRSQPELQLCSFEVVPWASAARRRCGEAGPHRVASTQRLPGVVKKKKKIKKKA